MDIGVQKPGRAREPLDVKLKDVLLPYQLTDFDPYVSDKAQYYYYASCEAKHPIYMTNQAAANRLASRGDLGDCYRCTSNYRILGPSLSPFCSKRYASYGAQCAWVALDYTLETPTVKAEMQRLGIQQGGVASMMFGREMGYVIEAKVLRGKSGAADIFIPLLNLVIQVDGEQHFTTFQQADVDARFNAKCIQQGRRLLRLYWSRRVPTRYHEEVKAAVERCLQGAEPFIMFSRNHPYCPK